MATDHWFVLFCFTRQFWHSCFDDEFALQKPESVVNAISRHFLVDAGFAAQFRPARTKGGSGKYAVGQALGVEQFSRPDKSSRLQIKASCQLFLGKFRDVEKGNQWSERRNQKCLL